VKIQVPALRRLGVLAALVIGCAPKPTIGLDTASAATAAIFTLAIPGSDVAPTIAAFRVDACAPAGGAPFEAVWFTRSPSDDGQPLARITYGIAPTGWRSVQGPHPLVPGCYRAAISRAAPLEFDVRPDGRIVERR
jgi:hypothetical protein